MSMGKILEKKAGKHPGKPLILFENQRISYGEFNQRANQVAHLFHSMKFKKGDIVALLISNRPEFLIIHAGLVKMGIIPALIGTHLLESALVHALNATGAKSLILGHECMHKVMKIREEIKLGEPGSFFLEKEGLEIEVPARMLDLSLLLCRRSMANPVVAEPVAACDPLEYTYTPGTGGLPQAAPLTQIYVIHNWFEELKKRVPLK